MMTNVLKYQIFLFKLIVFICLLNGFAFGQGPSSSPHDIKMAYLEKYEKAKQTGTKVFNATAKTELERLVKLLAENAPQSYEYQFIKYKHSRFNGENDGDLLAAAKMKPDAKELRNAMFDYYEMKGDVKQSTSIAKLILNSATANQINYYKNGLNVSKAKFMVFSGEEDARIAIALQRTGQTSFKGRIINLDYLLNPYYRSIIQKEIGMPAREFLGKEKSFIAAMVKASASTIAVSTTVSQSYLSEVKSQAYLSGLVYLFNGSNQRSDLDKFWVASQQYLTKTSFNIAAERKLYANYLPPLLTLYKLKKLNGEQDEPLKQGIILLATSIDKLTEVQTILAAYDKLE